MNVGHRPMAKWGLKYLNVRTSDQILDIGCGGGRNIKRLLRKTPSGRVFGVDYSALSVKKSRRLNADHGTEGKGDHRTGQRIADAV